MAEEKDLSNENRNGDFTQHSKSQCIDYLVSLNDPEEPFYSKDALERHDLFTLQVWASKAFVAREFMVRQGLMKDTIAHIPKELKMVHPPTAAEIIRAKEEEEKKNDDNDGFGLEKEKESNKSSNNSNSSSSNSNGNGNQQRGKKRKLDNFGLMPQNQGYELVTPEEAARFRAGGFAAVKSEVDKLAGIQFFKKINGNGQVLYCELYPDGSSKVRPLPQQRPLAYDSDDDVYDDGFQQQLMGDSFFGNGFSDGYRPKKRHRSRVAIGQMVRAFYYCVYDALVYDALVVLLVTLHSRLQ